MANVLVVELRGDVVPEDITAPLSEDELAALERSFAHFRGGRYEVTTNPADLNPTTGVTYYRKEA